jgi:hypothetical protein
VLGRAGPGLLATLRDVPSVLAFQGWQVWDHAGPIQVGLYALGTAWAVARARRPGTAREYLLHLAAAVLLLLFFMGKHHIRNYYAYPAALASVGVGMLAGEVAGRLARRLGGRPLVAATGVGLLMALALAPGAGLRVAASHLRHPDDPAYDVRSFTREILADIPHEALIAVDGAFVLEAYLQGRPVVEAIVNPFYFDVRTEPFDYAVFGPVGLKQAGRRWTTSSG